MSSLSSAPERLTVVQRIAAALALFLYGLVVVSGVIAMIGSGGTPAAVLAMVLVLVAPFMAGYVAAQLLERRRQARAHIGPQRTPVPLHAVAEPAESAAS